MARITHSTMNSELTFLSTQFRLCSAILVTRYISNCGQTPAVPELDWKTYLDSGTEDESHTSPSADSRAQFFGENKFSVPCDSQDDTKHRGNSNCARADDLTRN